MSPPKNVFWFEILLYAALTLDALSVALQDRGTLSVNIVTTAMSVEGALILLQFYFVWLAAQRRAGWPRCYCSLWFRFFRQLASRECTL